MIRLALALACASALAQTPPPAAPAAAPPAVQAATPHRSTVGLPAEIRGLVLDGSEVEAAASTPASKVVVRIDDVQKHGTAFRYALTFTGLEPGSYDLRDFLVRKDRTPLGGAPIPVQIDSILPKTSTQPNALGAKTPPDLGGYQRTLWLAGAAWLLGLLAILYFGRQRKAAAAAAPPAPITLADRLRPLVQQARTGDLPAQRRAELERLLLGVWRRRLALQQHSAAEAIAAMRAHPQAGALLRQLEAWLHAPAERDQHVDVDGLLAPYADLPADDPGGGA